MSILLVIGLILYLFGLCRLLQRFGQRSRDAWPLESEWNDPARSILIPDHVPPEWVDAYRAEQGG